MLLAFNNNDENALLFQIDILKKTLNNFRVISINKNFNFLNKIIQDLLSHKIFYLIIKDILKNINVLQDFWDIQLKNKIIKCKLINNYNDKYLIGENFEIIYLLGKILLLKTDYFV